MLTDVIPNLYWFESTVFQIEDMILCFRRMCCFNLASADV